MKPRPPLPRVRILHLEGDGPTAASLLPLLQAQLETAGMEIDTDGIEVADLPITDAAWFELAGKTAQNARTIAVVAYSCGVDICTVTTVQVRSRARFSLEFSVPSDPDKVLLSAVSTIREIILGPLLGEIRRLAEEAREPSDPEGSNAALLRSPFEDERKLEAPAFHRLLIEAAYQGDYPHPAGRPLHGVCVGVAFEPSSMLGLTLHVGWLGMGRQSFEDAKVGMHRLDSALTLRLIFSLGPARIAVGAVGRVDWVFLDVDNGAGRSDEKERYAEIHVGGITTWHLPLPRGLEFIIGAGLTASVLSREALFTGLSGVQETAMPASTLRMIWTAGLAFSPFRTPSGP